MAQSRRCAGSCPSDYCLLFHFFGCRGRGGHSRPAARSRRRAAPLSQAVFVGSTFCFCFQSRGADPLRGGGRGPTDPEIKKRSALAALSPPRLDPLIRFRERILCTTWYRSSDILTDDRNHPFLPHFLRVVTSWTSPTTPTHTQRTPCTAQRSHGRGDTVGSLLFTHLA